MAAQNDLHDSDTTLADIKQLGLWASIASLSYVFWIVGGMEMVERLAFYGVRAVATLYATRPVTQGGLAVTMTRFGTLLLCWNLVQSLVPIFTGGLSDRYGYKQTIFFSTVLKSLAYLVKPHLALYLLIFSVWWLMFPMLWDVLPKYIDEWVDTSSIVRTLFGIHGTQNPVFQFLLGLDKAGKTVQPEGIVNINAGMIMLTCFFFAGLSAKMRATTSLFVGTLFVSVALMVLGATSLAWFSVLALVVFSIGEMLSSPKYSEFLGNIAPPDKKAMWIGFSQTPILIGWTIEGKLGPTLYDVFSSKDEFARQMLVEHGMSAAQVSHSALTVGEAFPKLAEVTGQNPQTLTRLLYEQHHVGTTWFVFAVIGLLAAAMILCYGRWVKKLADQEQRAS